MQDVALYDWVTSAKTKGFYDWPHVNIWSNNSKKIEWDAIK